MGAHTPASLPLLGSLLTLMAVAGHVVRAQDTAQTQGSREATEPSGITGVVTAARTGQPLMGIEVIVKGAPEWAITDQNGSFRLARLKPGPTTVEFRRPNHAPLDYEVTLTPGQTATLAVQMDTFSVALPEVVVEGDETRIPDKMRDFYARRRSAVGGYFITRKDIEQKQPRRMSDMLSRVLGLRVDCSPDACEVRAFNDARLITGVCPIQYFLDGTPFMGNIDEFAPDEVEGVEVYRGSSTIPPEFNTGSSMCGIIAIWSRAPGR